MKLLVPTVKVAHQVAPGEPTPARRVDFGGGGEADRIELQEGEGGEANDDDPAAHE